MSLLFYVGKRRQKPLRVQRYEEILEYANKLAKKMHAPDITQQNRRSGGRMTGIQCRANGRRLGDGHKKSVRITFLLEKTS